MSPQCHFYAFSSKRILEALVEMITEAESIVRMVLGRMPGPPAGQRVKQGSASSRAPLWALNKSKRLQSSEQTENLAQRIFLNGKPEKFFHQEEGKPAFRAGFIWEAWAGGEGTAGCLFLNSCLLTLSRGGPFANPLAPVKGNNPGKGHGVLQGEVI